MAAVPIPDPERERAKPPAELEGDLPSPMNPQRLRVSHTMPAGDGLLQ